MFWRKTREAIGRFHPEHQRLTMERTVSMSARPGEWATVLASLSQHAATVKRRKWRLPSRATTVLVPLIHVLSEDTTPDGAIGIAADLRGSDAPGKAGPSRDLPARRPIRKLTEWFVLDPWLRIRAELKDGSVLEVNVTDRIRHRKVHKVSSSGKHKSKTKKKTVQRIDAKRTLPRGAAVHRPGGPPPGETSAETRATAAGSTADARPVDHRAHLTRIRSYLHTRSPLGGPITILTGSPFAADPRVTGGCSVRSAPGGLGRADLSQWIGSVLAELSPAELVVDAFPAGLSGELTARTVPAGIRVVHLWPACCAGTPTGRCCPPSRHASPRPAWSSR